MPDEQAAPKTLSIADALKEGVKGAQQTGTITFDDLDVWDPIGLAGTIHCTPEERAHLMGLINLGLHDSFRLFEQAEKSFSWWDYRDFGFKRNRGMRIDHILISDALKSCASACVIDKLPRKNERPSDHTPVVLTLR